MKDGESEASLPLETAGPQSSPLSLASPEPDLPKEQDSREKDPHEESFTAQEADDEDKAQKLSDLLVELGFLTHRELQQHMNQLGDVEDSHCDLSPFIDTTILRLLPDTMARQHMVLPLKKDSGELALATGHILSKAVLAEIQKATGIEVKPALVDSGELQASIEGCYRRQERLDAQQMRLGEYLLARGLIQKRQLESCLKEQEKSQEKLGELLVRHGYVTEDTVYSYLGKKLGYEYRRFSTSDIDVELSKLVSHKFVERNLILPLALDQDTQQLEVAMAEPYDLKVLDTLKTLVGHRKYELKPILSAPDNIKEGINYSYNFQEVFEDEVDIEWLAEERDDRKDLVATEDIPQIRRIINQVLYRAVVENASDVHIENQQTRVRVRFRLDGLLQERKTSITKDNIRSVCSVFKVDSGLDITESRRSQDGVFKMRIGPERYVDFRINLHATDFGQDAVIRVLDTTKNLLALEAVGFPPKMLDNYLSLVENPQGLILFTGPTGSGKSTTLYSTLAHLNSGDQKIVTAEDPVEYYLDGICQYKVNEGIGNTFAEYARRFLRKDPDIILIGEIRDEETAEACLKAATTGHLVFSTLHTNDSVGAVGRLRHLGVDSSTVCEALLAVLSQRLTRRVCTKCSELYDPDPALISLFFPQGVPEGFTFQHGAGCATCDYLGYLGRMGVYEYWELNPRMILGILNKQTDIRTLARQNGLMPLVEDGLRKVKKGSTTLEELRRVLPVEQIMSYSAPPETEG